MKRVLRRVEDIGIEHEDQRAVRTTWKLNVETLSETVRLLDISAVPKEFVKQLDESFHADPLAFREVDQAELLEQAFLIEESKSSGKIVFCNVSISL